MKINADFLKRFLPAGTLESFQEEYDTWKKVWNEKSQLDKQEHANIIAAIDGMRSIWEGFDKRIKDLEGRL